MADIIVDATLDDVNSALKDINDEFQHAQDNADAGSGVWGQRDVERAMHDFAHNWYVHRGKIQDRLGKLSTRVDQSCQAWADADKNLSEALSTGTTETGATDA